MTISRFVIFSAVVVFLAAITISEGMRVGPQRCCFSFLERSLKSKQVIEYSMTSQQCSREAVLLKTVKGRLVCARPTDKWVQDLMKNLDMMRPGGQGTL